MFGSLFINFSEFCSMKSSKLTGKMAVWTRCRVMMWKGGEIWGGWVLFTNELTISSFLLNYHLLPSIDHFECHS